MVRQQMFYAALSYDFHVQESDDLTARLRELMDRALEDPRGLARLLARLAEEGGLDRAADDVAGGEELPAGRLSLRRDSRCPGWPPA